MPRTKTTQYAVSPVSEMPLDGMDKYYRLHGSLLGAYFEICNILNLPDDDHAKEIIRSRLKLEKLSICSSDFYQEYGKWEQPVQFLMLQLDATENVLRFAENGLLEEVFGVMETEKELSSFLDAKQWADDPTYLDLQIGLTMNNLLNWAMDPPSMNYFVVCSWCHGLNRATNNSFMRFRNWESNINRRRREVGLKRSGQLAEIEEAYREYFKLVRSFSLDRFEATIHEIVVKIETSPGQTVRRFPRSAQTKIIELLDFADVRSGHLQKIGAMFSTLDLRH